MAATKDKAQARTFRIVRKMLRERSPRSSPYVIKQRSRPAKYATISHGEPSTAHNPKEFGHHFKLVSIMSRSETGWFVLTQICGIVHPDGHTNASPSTRN